jgi:endonuclease-3 related protein
MRRGNQQEYDQYRVENLKDTLLFICNRLAEHFGPLHWWPADSPFEVVIGAFLTQNTAWRNVELAIAALKRAVPLTPQAICGLERQRLEELIRPAGFFRQKAQRLQLFSGDLLEHYQGDLDAMLAGPLPQVRRYLLEFKGVGPETADSILLYAAHRPSFVVDAYTRRLLQRYGILQGGESYEQIRTLFMENLPRQTDLFNEYHALIVEQCKIFCRKRPLCDSCPLQPHCAIIL